MAKLSSFEPIQFSSVPALGEAQKTCELARLDAVCVFSHLFQILLKFQHGNFTNMNFSQKFLMQRYVFVILN